MSNRLKLLLLCLLLATPFTWAQQQVEINGQVVDETGETIIGASVSVDKQTIGTITDLDGRFTLEVPANATIVVSYLGFQTQKISLGAKTTLKIVLEEVVNDLDEVVVIGYGTLKKRDLTGSISSVKDKDIVMSPRSNAIEGVQGKIAGFDITRSSSKAGSEPNMQIRGNRSLGNNRKSSPLIIIDGMPGDYATLNPNDIASMEVLKDASSTAIYGVAGANGVILISTKNAEKGKPKINFNSFYGINGWPKRPKSRIGNSYLQLRRDAYAATGNWSSVDDDYKIFQSAAEEQAVKNGEWVDWTDKILKNGTEQNYSLSVSSSSDYTDSYFSLNYNNEEGLYKKDDNKIYSLKTKIDHRISKYVTVGTNLSVSYSHNNARKGLMSKATTGVPLGRPYNEDGSINLSPIAGSSVPSVLTDEQGGVYKNQTKGTRVVANAYIELKPIEGLSIKSIVNTQLFEIKNGTFKSTNSFDGLNAGWSKSQASKEHKNIYNYQWDNIISYNVNLNKKHSLTFTGVSSWIDKQQEFTLASAEGLPYDGYIYHNLGSGDIQTTNSSYNMSKLFSVLGRVNYSYLGRYLLSASSRYDGSSRLASGSQWKSFPAVSAGWRISEEKFMESTRTWLDNLKLRVGYGITGADNIDDFAADFSYETNKWGIGTTNHNGILLGKYFSNSDLTWEKTYGTNFGLDMNFLNSRINLTLDYYISNTKGLLFDRDMPAHMGQYVPSTPYKMTGNYASVRNNGFEFVLNTANIISKDFTWNSTVTFATNKEEMRGLPGGINEMIFSDQTIYKLGEPSTSFYYYKKTGIWQTNEAAEAEMYGKKPGDLKFATRVRKDKDGYYYMNDKNERVLVDKDHPYAYSANDYQVLGHNSPTWIGGFQNDFKYKDFDLSIFLYARYGQMIKYESMTKFDPQGIANSPKHFNYWTPNNPSNDFPAANSGKKINAYTGYESLQYVDGSFWKIKNITLGYTVPKSCLNKLGIERLRVYSTITNPFVFAKSHLLKDYDPEMNGNDDYPLTKQFVFGLNLTF